jgi:hypothetical protein
MKHSILSSTIIASFLLAPLGCDPNDHVVASNSGAVGGKGNNSVGNAGAPNAGVGSTVSPVAKGGVGGIDTRTPRELGGAAPGEGGTAGTGQSTSCAAYTDSTTGARVVNVTIRNDRSTPVYIGSRVSDCFKDGTLRLYDEQGRLLRTDVSTVCSCSTLMTQACLVYSCGHSPMRRIDPNTSTVLPLTLVEAVDKELPPQCQREGSNQSYCSQIRAIERGTYKLVVSGSTEWECAAGWDTSRCQCMQTNSCTDLASPVQGAGAPLEPAVQFDAATTNALSVTFTEDSSSAGAGGAGAGGTVSTSSTTNVIAAGAGGRGPAESAASGASGGQNGLGTLIDGECMDTRPGATLDTTCPATYCELRAQIARMCGGAWQLNGNPPAISNASERQCGNMKDVFITVNSPWAYGCRYQKNLLVGSVSSSDTGEYCGGVATRMGVGLRPENCSTERLQLCYAQNRTPGLGGGGAAGASGIIPGAAGAAQTGNGACYDTASDSCVSCP